MPVTLPIEVYEAFEKSLGREDAKKVVKSLETAISEATEYKWAVSKDEIVTEIRNEIKAFESRIYDRFDGLRNEIYDRFDSLRSEIYDRFDGLRNEIYDRFGSLRTEVYDKFDSLRNEIYDKFDGLRTEIYDKFDSFRAQVHADIESFKTELRNEIESFRAEVRAEIDTFKTEVRNEIELLRSEVRRDFITKELFESRISELRMEIKAELTKLDKKFTIMFAVLLFVIIFLNQQALEFIARLVGLLK